MESCSCDLGDFPNAKQCTPFPQQIMSSYLCVKQSTTVAALAFRVQCEYFLSDMRCSFLCLMNKGLTITGCKTKKLPQLVI